MHHSLEGRGRILISSSPWNLWWPFLRGESAAIGDSTAFAEMFSLFGVSVCVCVCVCVCVVSGHSGLGIREIGTAGGTVCPRTINVSGYNAIICYRLSPSPIELRSYYYRSDASLTLDYFCHRRIFPDD